MPDRVLPGKPNAPLLVVGEPVLDCQVDVIEADLETGLAEDGDHDQLLVAERLGKG